LPSLSVGKCVLPEKMRGKPTYKVSAPDQPIPFSVDVNSVSAGANSVGGADTADAAVGAEQAVVNVTEYIEAIEQNRATTAVKSKKTPEVSDSQSSSSSDPPQVAAPDTQQTISMQSLLAKAERIGEMLPTLSARKFLHSRKS
jgi:hypothetical protein